MHTSGNKPTPTSTSLLPVVAAAKADAMAPLQMMGDTLDDAWALVEEWCKGIQLKGDAHP